MAVLVTGKLHSGLECFWTVRTGVSALLAVSQQVMIVHRGCLETFATVLALIRSDTGVSTHVESQAVRDSECFTTDLYNAK